MNAKLLDRITIKPGQWGGWPCIRGMRIRVTDILSLLSAGLWLWRGTYGTMRCALETFSLSGPACKDLLPELLAAKFIKYFGVASAAQAIWH